MSRSAAINGSKIRRTYLLHLRDRITMEVKRTIEGILDQNLTHYLSHNTYIIEASKLQILHLQSNEHVSWIQTLNAALKVNIGHSSGLSGRSSQHLSESDSSTQAHAALDGEVSLIVSLISVNGRRSLEETSRIARYGFKKRWLSPSPSLKPKEAREIVF
jgi:hypothetical protein